MDFYFKHPTTIQCSGPTGCGKTWFVRRIIEKKLVQPFPTRIIWVYSEGQADYEHMRFIFPQVEFVEGWHENLHPSISPDKRNLLILDDQMDEAGDSKTLAKLFTKGSLHRNLTVIYLVQNVFNQSKSKRTVFLNSHYNFVYRNRRDESQIRTLAYQICPDNARWLLDAFKCATRRPHGHLILDHHPLTDEDSSLLTNILPDEHLTYLQKLSSKAPINSVAPRALKRIQSANDGTRRKKEPDEEEESD